MEDTFYDTVSGFAGQARGAKRKVAGFLLEHPGKAAFMSIAELAEAAGVSTGTVSNVMREMGFGSFAAMQARVQSIAKRHITPAARLEDADADGANHLQSLRKDQANLEELFQLNTRETFDEAAALLAHSRAVHVMGLRSSFTGAYFLAHALEQIRENVHIVDNNTGRLPEQAQRFAEGDLVVLISFPRYLKESVLMAEEARLRRCPFIAITDSVFSPIARHAAVTFIAPYESASFFNSNVAVLAVVNALICQVTHLLRGRSKTRLELHNAILQRWGTLVDSEGGARLNFLA